MDPPDADLSSDARSQIPNWQVFFMKATALCSMRVCGSVGAEAEEQQTGTCWFIGSRSRSKNNGGRKQNSIDLGDEDLNKT